MRSSHIKLLASAIEWAIIFYPVCLSIWFG